MDDLIRLPDSLIDPKTRRAQSIVGTSPNRPENDYYPTPPEATTALLGKETFTGSIWENSCGDGAICRVLEQHDYRDIMATDLKHHMIF